MKHTRLQLMFVFLVFIVLFSLGFFLNQMIKVHLASTDEEQMIRDAKQLIHTTIENGDIYQVDKQALREGSDILQRRSALFSAEGDVIFDSADSTKSEDKALLANILSQSRQKSILKVKEDSATYIRLAIQTDAEIVGYFIIHSEVASMEKAHEKISGMLLTSICLAFIIISFISTNMIRKTVKPVDSAVQVIRQLTKGNYRARTDDFDKDATGVIQQNVDQLAEKLQLIAEATEIQKNRLYTLVENMGSGLIFIDERGFIRYVNQAYAEVFRIQREIYLHRPYYETMKWKTVSDVIEKVFMTERKVRKQMLLPLTFERRHFEVYGAPIIGGKNTWKGILLVFHDITELKYLELMRKDFVANVSHELKTPITSIKGFSETLLDGAMYDKKALHSFLSIILKESERLQSLLQDLLDLSKIEHDEFGLTKQRFSIQKLLHEIYLLLKERAIEKQIKLSFQPNETAITIYGDIHRLKQVFINLISNAVSYTPPQGEIVIALNESKQNVIIQISDTGIGMKAEELPRIFERFYRVDKARSRDSGGTGLGLAIVKHLVEAHDGEITVESEWGVGTTFTVKLPKC